MFDVISSYFKGETYAARTFRGSALTVFSFGGQTFLRLASNLILTRILFPEAFGLMALVQVVLSGAAQFSDIGIRSSIVRDERGADPVFLNTAWTLQIARGFVLAAVIFFLAEPAAQFYGAPELADLLKFCALVPAIQGFNSTRIHSANRNIQLGRLTGLTIGEQIINITITMALAWWLQSVWALAIGTVIGAFILVIGTHVVLKGEKNWFALEGDATRRMFLFGKFIFFSTLAGFFLNQGDKLVLGKYVTLEELAVYNIGYLLAAMPLLLSGMLNDRIFFPLYARRPPSESKNNRNQINKARAAVTAGLLATIAFFALIGDALVRFLYDERYHAAGALMTLIALSLLPRLITYTYERMSLAYGHSGKFAILTVVGAVIQIAFLFLGVSYLGLLGAIIAQPATIIASYPLMIWINWPYRGWHALHDAFYWVVALGIAAFILWYRWPIVAPLFERVPLF